MTIGLFAQPKHNGYVHLQGSIRRGQRGGAVLAGGIATLAVVLGFSACATTGQADLPSHSIDARLPSHSVDARSTKPAVASPNSPSLSVS